MINYKNLMENKKVIHFAHKTIFMTFFFFQKIKRKLGYEEKETNG